MNEKVKQYLIIAGVVVVLLLLYHFVFLTKPKLRYDKHIKELQEKIDSLTVLQESYNAYLEEYDRQAASLEKQLQNDKKKLEDIKNQINEKLRVIDTYSNDQLKRAITDRYNVSSN